MNRIKKIRERFNLSRKDVSDILQRPIKYVVDVERGHEPLAPRDIEKLCRQFDLEKSFFVDVTDKPTDISDWDAVLGRNVKYFRELNGMTQQILAEEMGFAGPATISGIERGIKPIGKKAMLRLAELFNIHISELFNYHDPSVLDSHNKLLARFNYILNHKNKPENWETLLQQIDHAYRVLAEG
jgi:transcriptional regulator with XRE-family HTH domain